MRRLVTFLLAVGLLAGLARTALACSDASQADSTPPTTEQPRSQTQPSDWGLVPDDGGLPKRELSFWLSGSAMVSRACAPPGWKRAGRRPDWSGREGA